MLVLQAEKPEDVMDGGPESDQEGEGEEANSDKDRDESKGAKEEGCGEEREYEFTSWEERVLQVGAASFDSGLRACDMHDTAPFLLAWAAANHKCHNCSDVSC